MAEHDDTEYRRRLHRVQAMPNAVHYAGHVCPTVNKFMRLYVDGQIGYLEMHEEALAALAAQNVELMERLANSPTHPKGTR